LFWFLSQKVIVRLGSAAKMKEVTFLSYQIPCFPYRISLNRTHRPQKPLIFCFYFKNNCPMLLEEYMELNIISKSSEQR
jgi:hypothetical protein